MPGISVSRWSSQAGWRLWLAVAGLVAGCQSTPHPTSARHRPWEFALIGDMPYTDRAVTNDFPNLVRALNRAPLDFVVHDGDLKAGAAPCTDELFAARLAQFQTIRHPLFFVPGDNEWTDCNKTAEQKRAPLEALEELRTLFCGGIDQPMVSARSRRRVEHFTRVETFGNPDAHWVRVTVDARDPNLFRFRPEYVRENFVDHRTPSTFPR